MVLGLGVLAPLAPAVIAAAPTLIRAGVLTLGSYVLGEQVIKPIFTPKAVEAQALAKLPEKTQEAIANKIDVSTIALVLVGGAVLLYFFARK